LRYLKLERLLHIKSIQINLCSFIPVKWNSKLGHVLIIAHRGQLQKGKQNKKIEEKNRKLFIMIELELEL